MDKESLKKEKKKKTGTVLKVSLKAFFFFLLLNRKRLAALLNGWDGEGGIEKRDKKEGRDGVVC